MAHLLQHPAMVLIFLKVVVQVSHGRRSPVHRPYFSSFTDWIRNISLASAVRSGQIYILVLCPGKCNCNVPIILHSLEQSSLTFLDTNNDKDRQT